MSESIAFERVSDVLPAGFLFGSRGGSTKTGKKVYSSTDDFPEKFSKSFDHIVKGVEPGAITTGRKVIGGFNRDLTRGGVPINLRDELLALFSGIRIINVDAPRSYNYKLTEYNKSKRSVTVSEKFYSTEDIATRGGDVLVKELRKIQDEALLQQRKFYQVVQDAIKMGVPISEIRRANKRRLSNKEFNRILAGIYTPVNYSKSRMQKRVRDVLKAYPEERVDINFVYPKAGFDSVLLEYRSKSLKPVETKEQEIEDQRSEVIPRPEPTRVSQLQTPPLPSTPAPIVSGTQTANVVNPLSGLTQTETALLSPEEQLIRQRIKRV